MFMADFARALGRQSRPVELEFMAVSSYGQRATSSGVVRILKDLDRDIAGRHVIVVEDIVDSGPDAVLAAEVPGEPVRRLGRGGGAAAQARRDQGRVPVRYVGFDIPNEFVVGYGLDYAERYRELPFIGVLKPVGLRPRLTLGASWDVCWEQLVSGPRDPATVGRHGVPSNGRERRPAISDAFDTRRHSGSGAVSGLTDREGRAPRALDNSMERTRFFRRPVVWIILVIIGAIALSSFFTGGQELHEGRHIGGARPVARRQRQEGGDQDKEQTLKLDLKNKDRRQGQPRPTRSTTQVPAQSADESVERARTRCRPTSKLDQFDVNVTKDSVLAQPPGQPAADRGAGDPAAAVHVADAGRRLAGCSTSASPRPSWSPRTRRRRPSPTWPAPTRPSRSCTRSRTSCRTRPSTRPSAPRSRRACCSTARPAPVRRCWPAPSPARPACRSTRSPAPTSSRCSSVSAPPGSATCSSRPRRTRPPSSSSTRSTRSAATAAPASAAATTSASRRSTSCWSRWTASTPRAA